MATNRCAPVTVRFDAGRPLMRLYAHQEQAVERYADADAIALFFEMGCGKSLTTLRIAERKFRDGTIDGLLVIAPNDVHSQWYDEAVLGTDAGQELGIDFHAQCVGGTRGQKELYPFEDDGLFRLVTVNVDTFSTPHKWEQIVEWANSGRYMIAIDEATVIKNVSSKRSQRLLYEFNDVLRRGKYVLSSRKKFPVRAVLTGTPVTNGPLDLWAIMEFVEPNFFMRNYWSFREYYGMMTKMQVQTRVGLRDVDVPLTERTWRGIHDCQSFEEAAYRYGCNEDTYMTVKHQVRFIGPYKRGDELKSRLATVATFRKLTDCVDMPERTYVERRVSLSPQQQEAYDSMRSDLLVRFGGTLMTAKNRLVLTMRLQQISSGFIVGRSVEEYDDEEDVAPGEATWLGDTNPKLEALMRDVDECDKPLLILTHYSAEAEKIRELCEKAGWRTGLFTGWKVVGGVDAFKAGELDVLVANSGKIARGFNLQVAHTTLFYSNTFSMEVRQQAEFRTFRTGQREPCLYVDYTACAVDETVNRALRTKKGLLDFIRDTDMKEAV